MFTHMAYLAESEMYNTVCEWCINIPINIWLSNKEKKESNSRIPLISNYNERIILLVVVGFLFVLTLSNL